MVCGVHWRARLTRSRQLKHLEATCIPSYPLSRVLVCSEFIFFVVIFIEGMNLKRWLFLSFSVAGSAWERRIVVFGLSCTVLLPEIAVAYLVTVIQRAIHIGSGRRHLRSCLWANKRRTPCFKCRTCLELCSLLVYRQICTHHSDVKGVSGYCTVLVAEPC